MLVLYIFLCSIVSQFPGSSMAICASILEVGTWLQKLEITGDSVIAFVTGISKNLVYQGSSKGYVWLNSTDQSALCSWFGSYVHNALTANMDITTRNLGNENNNCCKYVLPRVLFLSTKNWLFVHVTIPWYEPNDLPDFFSVIFSTNAVPL